MKFRANTLKQNLRAGIPQNAAWVFSADSDAAEILGGCGFDAIILDREHTSVSMDSTLNQMRAIRAAGDSTVLVRVRRGDAAEVAVLLDMGAEGLLLPDARSRAEVSAFVESTRYSPRGSRGAHFTVSRAAGWGGQADEYRERFEEELLLIAMIESAQGADASSDLAHIDGLDLLFVGPLDLSASVDALGAWDDPRYLDLLDRAERLAHENHLWLGGALAPPGDAAAWIARGHRLVSVGSDVTFARSAAIGSREAFARPHSIVSEREDATR